MPSSVMLGSRPRICWMRAYSSRVTPCSAAISGVTFISALAVAIWTVRIPSADFLFEIPLKSARPITSRDTGFFGAHYGLSQFEVSRSSQKSPKLSPNGEPTRGAIFCPTHVYNILAYRNFCAIVNVGGLQDFPLLRIV